MLVTYRHRRSTYPLGPDPVLPRLAKKGAIILVIAVILFYLGSWVLGFFGVGNVVKRDPTILHIADAEAVHVTLVEGEQQRAENRMKLYADESVQTGASATAGLSFFDGTFVNLDDDTDLVIDESVKGEEESEIYLTLKKGSLWVRVPSSSAFSGSIVRTLETPTLSLRLPPETDAYISPSTVAIFSGYGQGAQVTVKGSGSDPIVIGEGQQFELKEGEALGSDLYAYRSPLKAASSRTAFVDASRSRYNTLFGERALATEDTGFLEGEILSITEPRDGMLVTASTINVKGRIAEDISTVRVNGYDALVSKENGTFTQELAVSPGDFTIDVKALDSEGNVVAEGKRLVKKEATASSGGNFAAPTITVPAKNGETYKTQQEEIVIRGTSPAGAAGILVNEYRLQLFSPEKGEWSYVAATRFGNLKQGTNTFDVVAIDGSDGRSDPVRLTIILGEEGEGVVPTTGSSSSAPVVVDPSTLPTNAPLKPGSLSVTAPTPGTSHTETGTGFLLEGGTVRETASIWVNDYRLQLYSPGKTFWNYKANTDLGTLKRGKNVYKIVARNEKNEIIDVLEYNVEYNP